MFPRFYTDVFGFWTDVEGLDSITTYNDEYMEDLPEDYEYVIRFRQHEPADDSFQIALR